MNLEDYEFEWNDEKRLSNLEKHGLDFLDAYRIFEGVYFLDDAKNTESEIRSKAIGQIDGRFICLIFTIRADKCRIISMRRARRNERTRYIEILRE